MKKILLVTGRTAQKDVKARVGKRQDCEIHVCQTDVASLLSKETIIAELKKRDLSGISMIIVPGGMRGDFSGVTKELGVICFKGPRYIADLPMVLDLVYSVKLSSEVPADEILKEQINKDMETEYMKALKRKPRLMIGGLGIGTGVTHVLAEIPDAAKLSDDCLAKKAKYYVDSGAAIVDVGMTSGEDNHQRIAHIFDVLRREIDVPISIDSTDEKEILAGVDAGADLVLSIDESNRRIMPSIDVPVVVIPRDKNGIPPEPEERARVLEATIEKLGREGFDKIVADPILEPVNLGFVRSMAAYYQFRQKHQETPMLMGAGNVTELFDADSVGINALIAGACCEMNIDIVFTTEASRKTTGCVAELAKASRMMHVAGLRHQVPKDLYIDMLYFKDKEHEDMIPETNGVPFTCVAKTGIKMIEPHSFRIYLTDMINVLYYKDKTPVEGFRGRDAKDLYKAILNKITLTSEHAAYLGKEVYKAEIALKLGKSYVQDRELF
ncbi:MAG: hypothetical protein MSIBF_04715 [Candidatus Altiarchaeales archaeon IMC4]|nr:MAG: hypothetical protein MSIBF_04715 [Candidatus Altiarchaeales archaeon IMC4]